VLYNHDVERRFAKTELKHVKQAYPLHLLSLSYLPILLQEKKISDYNNKNYLRAVWFEIVL
jgi:hypothetical protein